MRRNSIVVVALAALALAACSSGSDKKVSVSGGPATTGGGTAPSASATGNTATIETNMGTIVVELDRAHAPKAAGQFAKLATSGFYNNTPINRVVPDFVIQGGDPGGQAGNCNGKPSVAGETPTDGYPIGSLAAAKTQNDPPGTFGCQFFIVTGEQGTTLPPDYARFGKVIKGMDVAKRIESLSPPDPNGGAPTKNVVVNKITIS